MNNTLRKKLLYSLVVLVLIIISLLVLWRIGKSRSFQFFGEIVPRVETSQKVLALTFDDGPSVEGTPHILEVLAAENVKATFFVIGEELEQNMAQGKMIVTAGHELGNHSYSHKRMLLVSPEFVKQEIESTDKLIREAGFQGEIYFRPPYAKKLFTLPYYLWKHNRKSITWDIESDSSLDIGNDPEKITADVLSKTRPGSIIVLHVMYPGRTASIKAVPKIIEGLRTQGYSFKTISELLAVRN